MLCYATRAIAPGFVIIIAAAAFAIACNSNEKRTETCAVQCDEVASNVPCDSPAPKDCDKQRQALRSDCSTACAAPALHGP